MAEAGRDRLLRLPCGSDQQPGARGVPLPGHELWRRTLRRRSQADGDVGSDDKLADAWLPQPRILHPWPSQRFAVKHPR